MMLNFSKIITYNTAFAAFFFLLLFFTVTIHAQTHSFDLVTDRPDQTESSMVVTVNMLQIETGFVYESKTSNSEKYSGFTYNSTLLRYGLLNNFELRAGLEYLGEKNYLVNALDGDLVSGLSPLYTGFKFYVIEEDGFMPEIAFIGGLTFPFTAAKNYKTDHVASDFRFAFTHTLSPKLSLGYNLGAEWDGSQLEPNYIYSIVLGFEISDKSGVFIESYGTFQHQNSSAHLMDAGLTYLLLPNFQLDLSAGVGLNDNAIDRFVSFGISYRITE